MKNLLIAVLVSFLLLAFGCASTSNGTMPKTNQESTSASQPNTAKDPYSICFSESSTSQGTSTPVLTSCLIRIAVDTGNESVCKYNFGHRYSCECFLKLSEKKGVAVCESYVNEYKGQVTSFADDCYTYIAAKNRDASVCDSIKVETRKASCVAIAKRNADLCSEFSNDCVITIASLEMDPKICAHEQINFNCITNIAVIKKDSAICNLLDDTQQSWGGSNQKSCLNAVATNAKGLGPSSLGGCYEELNGNLER
ncbi:MAG: hypothetical protein NTV88_03380 [Candidatus Micrarchaeota archaeon]|nr:hypothetical protein [Candidatus Micrarchaeota archaeon]